jgi:hypothetical protein
LRQFNPKSGTIKTLEVTFDLPLFPGGFALAQALTYRFALRMRCQMVPPEVRDITMKYTTISAKTTSAGRPLRENPSFVVPPVNFATAYPATIKTVKKSKIAADMILNVDTFFSAILFSFV